MYKSDERLTQCDEQGNWCLKDVAWKSLYSGNIITPQLSEKLYGALCKLKDYEETELSPDEIDCLKQQKFS